MSSLSLSLSLRVAAIFEIFILALIGIILPFLILRQLAKKTIFQSESTYESHAESRDEENVNFNMKSMLQGLFFMSMKSVSAGVMLGVAMLHLIPDADGDLSEVYPDYSLANAFTCFGIVLVVAIDQFTISWVQSRKNSSNSNLISMKDMVRNNENSISIHDHSHSHDNEECGESCHLENGNNEKPKVEFEANDFEHNERCSFVECEHEHPGTYLPPKVSMKSSMGKNENGNKFAISACLEVSKGSSDDIDVGEGEMAELMSDLLKTDDLRTLVTTYVMELSIAVHSVIIGVNLGLLGEGDVTTIVSLMLALGFHQAVEGFGLGAQMASAHFRVGGMGSWKVSLFMLIFCLTLPAGILVGILLSSSGSTQSSEDLAAKGVANAVAAGFLLYVSLTEMLGSVFSKHGAASIRRCAGNWHSLSLVGGFALGVAFMALLAVWA